MKITYQTQYHTLKNILVNCVFVLSIIFFFSCKVSTENPRKLPKKNIAIGSSGGFAGTDVKLVFLKNGQIFSSISLPVGDPKLIFVKEVSKAKARKIFETAEKINFEKLPTGKPGNMNFYIERNRRCRKDTKYSWTGDLDSLKKDTKLILKLLELQN